MRRHGIRLNSNAVGAYCRKWKIRELFVFGSYLRDDFRTDSDIDLLAKFEDDEQWDLFDHMEMQEELEAILNRKVELLDRKAMKRHENWLLRRVILATEEKVYAG
jgi:predicted nucleotidyltransferase